MQHTATSLQNAFAQPSLSRENPLVEKACNWLRSAADTLHDKEDAKEMFKQAVSSAVVLIDAGGIHAVPDVVAAHLLFFGYQNTSMKFNLNDVAKNFTDRVAAIVEARINTRHIISSVYIGAFSKIMEQSDSGLRSGFLASAVYWTEGLVKDYKGCDIDSYDSPPMVPRRTKGEALKNEINKYRGVQKLLAREKDRDVLMDRLATALDSIEGIAYPSLQSSKAFAPKITLIA